MKRTLVSVAAILSLSGCMHVYTMELKIPPVLSCSGIGCVQT